MFIAKLLVCCFLSVGWNSLSLTPFADECKAISAVTTTIHLFSIAWEQIAVTLNVNAFFLTKPVRSERCNTIRGNYLGEDNEPLGKHAGKDGHKQTLEMDWIRTGRIIATADNGNRTQAICPSTWHCHLPCTDTSRVIPSYSSVPVVASAEVFYQPDTSK